VLWNGYRKIDMIRVLQIKNNMEVANDIRM